MDSQSLLQHSYFIAAAAIVLALVALRIFVLRRRNRALSDFFRVPGSQYPYGSHPHTDSSYGPMRHGVQLTPLPAAYHPDRRIHAADIDAHGRRLGPAGEDWDGKDALPAYDNFDRPPKYLEAGWSHGGLPQLTSRSMITHSPEEDQSGVPYPSTSARALGNTTDQPYDDTLSETHVVEPVILAPAHHNLPDS